MDYHIPHHKKDGIDSVIVIIRENGCISSQILNEIEQSLWDGRSVTADDRQRWLLQGIHTASLSSGSTKQTTSVVNLDDMAASVPYWGLVQSFGGPCGVLAVIQAELLALLLFGRDVSCRLYDCPTLSSESTLRLYPDKLVSQQHDFFRDEKIIILDTILLHRTLATALGWILARAALSDEDDGTLLHHAQVHLVLPSSFTTKNSQEKTDSDHCVTIMLNNHQYSSPTPADVRLPVHDNLCNTIRQSFPNSKHFQIMSLLAYSVADYLLSIGQFFETEGGVLRFTQSLMLTRGLAQIKTDMDDPSSSHLTSQFGQCSQELINLALTGKAVSNVFDNSLSLYDGSVQCRGISSQPYIGYLTQLEALRYCQVGSFFKTPQFPIWIIGSQSHFSVLFATDYEPFKENPSQILLHKCRRAFMAVPCAEENGFIPSLSLTDILKALGLFGSSYPSENNISQQIILSESDKDSLMAYLEIQGSGIILWDDFWKATSRLLTGTPLKHIIQGNEWSSRDDECHRLTNPLMLTQFGEHGSSSFKTDEQIARELQLQYDQELSNAGVTIDTKLSSNCRLQSATCEKAFRLHYYNGLRGGTLSTFRVIQQDYFDDSVGKSVGLVNSYSTSQGDAKISYMPTSGNALESIIRTRWPTCNIDWCGNSPPSVD